MVYMAGNGGDNDPAFVKATGAQILTPSTLDESAQTPGAPTPVGSFGVTELGPKEGGTRAKEDNFRGLAIANNVLYYATTSTVSGNTDQGADSNCLVEITDPLGATSQPSDEAFHTLSTASADTLYRGISFTPGS